MAESDNKTHFRSSSPSRQKQKDPGIRLWLLIPIVLAAVAGLFFFVKFLLDRGDPAASSTAANAETSAEEPVSSSEKESSSDRTSLPSLPGFIIVGSVTDPDNSEEPSSSDSPSVPTASPTEAPTQPGPVNPSENFHLYTAEELLPLPEDIDRGLFKDIPEADTHGGWWFGSRVRDLSTGEVTVGYDRSAETLALLDKYGAIYRKNEDQKVVYLTFDCGYEYGNTNSILDTLKEKNVKAVFFCTGSFVDDPKNKDILLRMYNEGHMIGSHTDHHKAMPLLTDEEFISEMNGLQLKINALLGFDFQLSYYRPPEGATNERDLCLAKKMGYTTVLWSYGYGDYNVDNQPDPAASLEKAKIGLHDGAVYLLHAVSSTNAEILGDLIDYMKAEGYDIRRIDY